MLKMPVPPSLLSLALLPIGLAWSSCKPDAKETAETGQLVQDTADTGTPIEVVSDYNAGRYRVTTLQLLDSEQGYDLDGDGEVNNKLPSILTLVNLFISEIDLSPDGFNATLTDSLATGTLVLLIEAEHVEGKLTYDLLLGKLDEDSNPSLDAEQSLNEDGVPYGRLNGVFTDQTHTSLGPDDIQIPITFYPDEPALMVPLVAGIAEGELLVETTTGILGGAVPVDELVDQVVAPMIPEEGYSGKTKEEWLDQIESMANDENMSDILLEDGRRAFSAALMFDAAAAEWSD